ncbi:MAG TPA: hypothetical protein VNO30_17135 [Kofleriaceae bacterium]|nr:hypothetical protein [Kofleriaceae bacterium]
MKTRFTRNMPIVCLVLLVQPAAAQPAKSEAEHLVPPQGGAVDVPVHAGEVCILSFPEQVARKAITSSQGELEINPWGDDGVAVRAVHDKVHATTLALATVSGQVKVNVTLRVVPRTEPALTLVRFKPASAEEAFAAQVAAEVARRVAPIEARLAKDRKELDATIRRHAEGLIAERLLGRNEIVRLESHARNDDHVIVHVRRGLLFGEDGFLIFEIENRSGAAYRLASVRVLAGGRDVAGETRLASSAIDRDTALIGVVPAGATARGIVTVRSANAVLNRPLALELTMPEGRGTIRADRGIVLR